MTKFFWVQIKSPKYNGRILMEEGTQFENKSFIYTMQNDGKLSIFNKNDNQKEVNNTINLNNYQWNVFKAVMNNDTDNKKVDALSNKDIEKALIKHKNGQLTSDLSEFLTDYEVKNARRFDKENKISAYITNGIKKFSSVIAFQFNISSVEEKTPQKTVKKTPEKKTIEQTQGTEKNVKITHKGAFLGNDLFKHSAITVKKSFNHQVQKGEDLVTIAKKYELDTYQLIAANPQLKINKDYTVKYPQRGLAVLSSTLKAGTYITIPARYDVKANSCKSLEDVAQITGVSKTFLEDFLTKIEVENQDGIPDLEGYLDDGGTPTIGYGHTGKVDGKAISTKRGKATKITKAKALEILAEDLLKHKAMTMAYLGKENYLKAPKSVQDAILDIAYNKGIWDGYLSTNGYTTSTSKVKKDLENGHYASALVHTRREKTNFRGLRKRNIYRFISGLNDLNPKQRKSAMDAMQQYYNDVLRKCKEYDKPALKNAWENARKGNCTGYTLK